MCMSGDYSASNMKFNVICYPDDTLQVRSTASGLQSLNECAYSYNV